MSHSSGDQKGFVSETINNHQKSVDTHPTKDESDNNEKESKYLSTIFTSAEWKELTATIQSIRKNVETKVLKDKTKEEAFERLYEELDAFKRNKAFEDNRPLFIDLILFYDRIQATKQEIANNYCEIIDSICEELQEILLRREIKIIKNHSEYFNPTYQRAVSTSKVDSFDLNNKVIHVLREGFEYKGNILRPQEVVIGKVTLSDMFFTEYK